MHVQNNANQALARAVASRRGLWGVRVVDARGFWAICNFLAPHVELQALSSGRAAVQTQNRAKLRANCAQFGQKMYRIAPL